MGHKVNQAANTSAIQTTYQQVFGRTVTPDELAAWQQALAHGESANAMRDTLAHSGEAAAHLGDLYGNVLGRAADAGGLAAYEDDLARGLSLSGVRDALAHSDEAKADIKADYQQVLGRDADTGGLASCQDDLAGGLSLSGVRDALVHSARQPTRFKPSSPRTWAGPRAATSWPATSRPRISPCRRAQPSP